ncbi:MAG: hypothetical protein M3Q14_04140 [bacterium]|nr:hypothetical protein [bacterium]
MYLIAHSGVEYASELQESVHASSSPVLTIALVSLITAVIVTGTIYLMQRRVIKIIDGEGER